MKRSARRASISGVKLIAVLVAVAALNPIGSSVVLPSLPSIRVDLATDVATTQFVLSGYLFATAVGQLLVGSVSDRFGRLPVLFIGLGIFCLAGIACALVSTMGALIVARVIQGIGGCAGVVISRAVLRDLFERDRAASALGYVTMGMAVAPMIAPILGGVVDQMLGWRAVFVLMVAAALLILGLTWFVLPETRPIDEERQIRSPLANIATLLSVPAFWAYALTTAFTSGVWFSFLAGAPFIAAELLGFDSIEVGISLAVTTIGYFIGNFLSGRFSQRFGVPLMIAIGNTIQLVTISVMVMLTVAGWLNVWTFFSPVAIISIGNGIALPNAIAGSLSVRPDLAGTASGTSGSIQFGMGAVAMVITGSALAVSPTAFTLVAVMAVFAVLGTIASLWSRHARS